MKIVRGWLRLGALLCAVGFVVAGCSDADGNTEPTAGPTVEVPTTTEPEPSPTVSATEPAPGPIDWPEPVKPAAMERDDIEGAKAAAEYFLALYPYVYVTGDLGALSDISHPECQFCESIVENVEDLHRDDGYADGPSIEVLNLEAAPPDDEYEFYSVWIEANESASSRFDSLGELVQEFEASSIDIDFALTQVDGEWLVRGVVGTSVDRADDDA